MEVEVLDARPGRPVIQIVGEGQDSLPRDARNLVYRTIAAVFKKTRKPVPRLGLTCLNRIPLARGLGSSATAYLLGLLAGNRLAGESLTKAELLDWASDLEGHPDNVAPALLGGVRASAVLDGRVVSAPLPIPKCSLVVLVPDFELSTKRARAVLPNRIPLRDAVSNLAAVSLLPRALSSDLALLRHLLNDRWHEPYRAKLVPGFFNVKKAALAAGAYGVTLSGAGPTLLAFSPPDRVRRVSAGMVQAFKKANVRSAAWEIAVDTSGAWVK